MIQSSSFLWTSLILWFTSLKQVNCFYFMESKFPPLMLRNQHCYKRISPIVSVNDKIRNVSRNSLVVQRSMTKSSLFTFNYLHNDLTFCLSIMLCLSTFGIALEKNTMIGKALSAPLSTMAMGLIVANLGIIPFASPVCEY